MAMNKKEQAMVEALKVEALKVEAAFKRTSEILPDVPPPESCSDELTKGFLFNAYCIEVRTACSSATGHSHGRNDRTSSQRARSLYSTRLLALKAMRFEVEKRIMTELRKVDRQIEIELANIPTNDNL
jgi:hypothetical protein